MPILPSRAKNYMGATPTLHERNEYLYSAIVQLISFLLILNKVSWDEGCEWCSRINFSNTEKSAIPDINKISLDNVKMYVTQV